MTSMVLFQEFASDNDNEIVCVINHKLLSIARQIVDKIGLLIKLTHRSKSILLQNNNLNFAWMTYFNPRGMQKVYCSITTHDVVDYYEISITGAYIAIYSYKWQNYAINVSKTLDKHVLQYVLQQDAYFISSLDKFKIILLDILQDVFALLDDEFHILDDESCYRQAQIWFDTADHSVQILRVIK